MDSRLHPARALSAEVVMNRFTLVVVAGAVVSSVAACAESELEPQVPVNAQIVRHETMKNPDIRDGFPQIATYESPPPGVYRESVSLGYIGDEPLGRYDAEGPPPHTPPYWTRPFGTLPQGVAPYPPVRARPLGQYDAPYYPYYAPPPGYGY
jgi:hypothetical protein